MNNKNMDNLFYVMSTIIILIMVAVIMAFVGITIKVETRIKAERTEHIIISVLNVANPIKTEHRSIINNDKIRDSAT